MGLSLRVIASAGTLSTGANKNRSSSYPFFPYLPLDFNFEDVLLLPPVIIRQSDRFDLGFEESLVERPVRGEQVTVVVPAVSGYFIIRRSLVQVEPFSSDLEYLIVAAVEDILSRDCPILNPLIDYSFTSHNLADQVRNIRIPSRTGLLHQRENQSIIALGADIEDPASPRSSSSLPRGAAAAPPSGSSRQCRHASPRIGQGFIAPLSVHFIHTLSCRWWTGLN